MFENDDEFGIDEYRDDVSYVMKCNSVVVKLISQNEDRKENLQGDFLGIIQKDYKDTPRLIEINMMSLAPDAKRMGEAGYSGKGNITYKCYAPFDTVLKDGDKVQFLDDNRYGIDGEVEFKVKMEEEGLFQMQYSYRSFNLVMV